MTSDTDKDALKQQVRLLEEELAVANIAKSALEQQLVVTSNSFAEVLTLLETTQTDLKQQKKATKHAKDFVDLAFNSMDSLLIMINSQGLITSINEATTYELDFAPAALIGKPIDCLFCPEDMADQGLAQQSLFDLIKEHSHFAGQHVLLTAEQHKLNYVVKASLQYDRYGNLSGGIVSAINITSLLNQQSELKKSETVMNLLMSTANDALIVTDEQDKIVLWNAKAEHIFGYTKEDVKVLRFHDIIVSPKDRALYYKGLPHFKKVGLGPAINCTREVTAYRKDGSAFTCEVSISSGRLDGRWHAFGVVRDITERKTAQNALVVAKTEADKANVAKSQFLATMSHEIRTPINGIIGMLHLCQQTELDEQQQDFIDKTEFSAKNLLTIINDILDFSKVEAGKMELEEAPFSLQTIKESVLSAVGIKAREKSLQLNFEIASQVPLDLIGDVNRLNQILLNLSSNAIKFTASGTVSIAITLLELTEKQCSLQFSVTDTGIGIAESTIGYLFESFKQADNSTTRKFGGTGLGLAISQKLSELMGGKINVQSKLGQGSTFSVELSFGLNNHFILPLPTPSQFAQPLDIILIDDNEISVQCISEALIQMGARVTGFVDAQKALDTIKDQTPDLVLSDWKMPNICGISFFKKLGEQLSGSKPMMILMSAYDIKAQIDELDALSIDAVIKKPLDLKRLKLIVEEGRSADRQPIIDIRGKTVLVAEDNPINRQVVEAILNSFGMNVETVENGEEAVEKLKDNQYDLILMDIQMPVMDGVEATKVIRQQLKITTPIAALTANVMSDDINAYLSAGMNLHIAKPINPDDLKAIVTNLISTSVSEGG